MPSLSCAIDPPVHPPLVGMVSFHRGHWHLADADSLPQKSLVTVDLSVVTERTIAATQEDKADIHMEKAIRVRSLHLLVILSLFIQYLSI